MLRFLLVSGGGMSGLGKGISSSSVGQLLQYAGLAVTYVKIDPYLNRDASRLSPYEHGEVFVLADGTQTDLDLGTFERFVGNVGLTKLNSLTGGRVMETVREREAAGYYQGATIQVVPHVTDIICERLRQAAQTPVANADHATPDICIVELGGTLGDIEITTFLEALSRLQQAEDVQLHHIHVGLCPSTAGGLNHCGSVKTKPLQHSVRYAWQAGLPPSLVFARCGQILGLDTRRKIATTCRLPVEDVVSLHQVRSTYQVPRLLWEQKVHERLVHKFDLTHQVSANLRIFAQAPPRAPVPAPADQVVTVGLAGKYTTAEDAYLSVRKALEHSGYVHSVNVQIRRVQQEKDLVGCHAVLVPGGFGVRGVVEKLAAIRWAREHQVPFLGICLGFQLALLEYAQGVRGLRFRSAEIHPDQKYSAADPDVPFLIVKRPGNDQESLRVGAHPVCLDATSRAGRIYNHRPVVHERFRHRYCVDPAVAQDLRDVIVGWSQVTDVAGNQIPEVMELTDHPFFVAVQFHPEFVSTQRAASPLFAAFVAAAKVQAGLD